MPVPLIDLRAPPAPLGGWLPDLRWRYPAAPRAVPREELEPDDIIAPIFAGYPQTWLRAGALPVYALPELVPVWAPAWLGVRRP